VRARNDGFWVVPKLWENARCYILGGGPGLNQVDLSRLKGQHVIAVNHAFMAAPWADVMFFNDKAFYMDYGERLRDFSGMKVSTCEAEPAFSDPGIRIVRKRNSPPGISSDRGVLVWNTSSGACAINLAVHLGATDIVLYGFDMRRVDEYCNWHEEKAKTPAPPAKNPYRSFLVPFPAVARDLARLKISCTNATPGSGLTEFPVVSPEETYPPRQEAHQTRSGAHGDENGAEAVETGGEAEKSPQTRPLEAGGGGL